MKKLMTVTSLFALLFLFLAGCQKSSDVTSPDNLNKPVPPPVYVYNCDPVAISAGGTATVDLIAGQHNPVGTATFTLDGSGLHVLYDLNAGVGFMTEVHIDFASALNNDAAHGGFHANSTGNPQPGQFDVNVTLNPVDSSFSLDIPLATLKSYINPANPPATVTHFYIAAHGVVNYYATGGAGTCPTLVNGKYRWLQNVPGVNYYAENIKIYDQPDQGSTLLYTLNGWCVDRENGAKPGQFVQVDFLCSTEDISCYVDLPENIGAVNWVLNNKVASNPPYDPYRTVQVVIWKLLDNSQEIFNPYDTLQVDALYNAALQHNDFVPGCGDIIGVLMYETGIDYCNGQAGMQVFIVEQPVECGGGGSDTMWGFPWDYEEGQPVAGESCRFVDQGNWARYFQF
jgi:hypothetical protein